MHYYSPDALNKCVRPYYSPDALNKCVRPYYSPDALNKCVRPSQLSLPLYDVIGGGINLVYSAAVTELRNISRSLQTAVRV